MADKTPMEELVEKRAARLRLEKRLDLLLEDFLELEDHELADELEREGAALRELEGRLESLLAVLDPWELRRYNRAADEAEGGGELRPAADAFFERFRAELGVVTVRDAHNLWELEKAADELEKVIGKLP